MVKKFLVLFLILGLVLLTSHYEVQAGSLTDIMEGMGDQEVPEDGMLSEATSKVTSFAGILISVIIYLFLALTALTTAIDLLYIAFPPIRSILYPKEEAQLTGHTQPQPQLQVQGRQQVRKKCWITNELKHLMQTHSLNNKKALISSYFKVRIVSVIFTVAVMILFATSSLFTDTGINIGRAILKFLGF